MIFEKIEKQDICTYAVFSLETSHEREFFENFNNYMSQAPIDVCRYFARPYGAVGIINNDRIDLIVDYRSGNKPGIFHFLTDLFKKNVISKDLCKEVEMGIKKFNAKNNIKV